MMGRFEKGGLFDVWTFRWVSLLRGKACAVGVAVLILHALLTAFVPPELQLLANHDHLALGYITPEAWQEHLKFHLQQARDLLDGVKAAAGSATQHVTNIISLLGCDLSVVSTSPLALAVLPVCDVHLHIAPVVGGLVAHPHPLDLSPQHPVPHLPPRNQA